MGRMEQGFQPTPEKEVEALTEEPGEGGEVAAKHQLGLLEDRSLTLQPVGRTGPPNQPSSQTTIQTERIIVSTTDRQGASVTHVNT